MTRLILASSSPRRKEILNNAGIPYIAISPDADEAFIGGYSPEDYVQELARKKALSVIKEADDNDTYCNDLFDEIEKRGGLTITGATLIWMRFVNSQGSYWEEGETPEAGGGNWHCPTDYEVRVSMN